MTEKIPVEEQPNFCLRFLAKNILQCPQYDFKWYFNGQYIPKYLPKTMIEKIIFAWVCILGRKILKNVWLWKPFSTTSDHKNDSTRGLPYQYTVHQALQIMRIHVNRLMKSWPPHSEVGPETFYNLFVSNIWYQM